MKSIAIIPARSGSKGIKDKNIKNLCGKPLIAYTIEAAVKSNCFDEVMVSTDSEFYSTIAKRFGASVPFLRSEKNSSDTASSWDMVGEVLNKYKELGQEFDDFCLLQPTSPLRNSNDIQNAYREFYNNNAFAVVSVCEAEHSPLWCGQLPENNEFIGFVDQANTNQRQDGGKFYRINGAIYIVDCKRFEYDKNLYKAGSFAYIMDQSRSVDIDTYIDFYLAEKLMSLNEA